MISEGVITEVILNDKSSRPTCLKFQHGELIENQETNLSCGLYMNDANRVMPVLASDTLIYTGSVVGQNAFNTFLAIKNKKTNKIKLVAINEAMVKPQAPKLREIMDSTMMEVNKRALTDLNKEFGSKKTKRQTETLERLKVNVDNFKDQLEKTVANVSLEDIEIQEVEQTSDVLPYINKSAEDPAEVYSLETMIPSSVLRSLEAPAKELLTMEEDDIKTSAYIKTQILQWQTSGAKDISYHISILLVLDAIIGVYSNNVKALSQRSYKASQYSTVLSKFVMATFTVTSGKSIARPLAMKDKACCFIIILTLFLNKNDVDLEEISSQLKLSMKKLNELCSMLLLTVKEKHAFVKLPLPAPRVFTPKVKRGKGK